eukprot:6049782-Ditylum_brightwellii.AAC.1
MRKAAGSRNGQGKVKVGDGDKTTRTDIEGSYMGDGPSSTEGEAFGICLLHDCYIAEQLMQKDMSREEQKELLQHMGDILALPTTPC